MKNVALLLIAVVGLCACKEKFQGELELNNQTVLINNRNKNITLSKGSYAAKLKAKKENLLEIKLTAGKKTYIIPFNLPENFELPLEKGFFLLSSSDSGQPVDLHGELKTDYSESKAYKEYESCTYNDYREVCERWVDEHGRVHYRCYCQFQSNSDGERLVEFYFEYSDKHLSVRLNEPGSENTFGILTSSHRNSNKIYIYKGQCRARFHDSCSL